MPLVGQSELLVMRRLLACIGDTPGLSDVHAAVVPRHSMIRNELQ